MHDYATPDRQAFLRDPNGRRARDERFVRRLGIAFLFIYFLAGMAQPLAH